MQPHTNGFSTGRGPTATGQRPTVADATLDQLASWGVERVYGVVGDTILPLISAMAERTTPRFVPTVNEQAAVFMAKAEAILTGGLGVCIATAGPGAAQLINGMADAQTDSVAVLAITGQVESQRVGTSYKQAIDQQALFSAVTEMSCELRNPAALIDVLGRLMRTAVAKSKAVHFGVPKDFWQVPLDELTVRPPEPYLKTPARSPKYVIKEALQLMRQASRPAILVGVGARRAIGDVLSLAESLRAPVISTLAALGQIPGKHHLNLGSVGEGGSAHALQILEESDLILRLGTTWWPAGFVPGRMRTIDVNVRPEHLGMNTPTAYGIAGPIEEIVPKLLWEAPNWARPEWEQRIFAARSAWEQSLADEVNQGNASLSHPIHPAVLASALSTHMPQDAVISLDVGDHVLWFNRHFRGTGRQDILFSGYWRTMGFGLPAAIGAKMAQPYRPSVAIVGDGGFSMSLSEWMTAVRYRLPITVILFNNRSLAMEENRMEQEGMHPMGVRLHNPDFTGFVRGSGAQAFKVERADQLADALNQAFHPTGPVLVDVSVQKAPFPTLKPFAFHPSGNRVEVGV